MAGVWGVPGAPSELGWETSGGGTWEAAWLGGGSGKTGLGTGSTVGPTLAGRPHRGGLEGVEIVRGVLGPSPGRNLEALSDP